MLTCVRNAWQRLRNAILARAIRLLLLRHPHAVSPLPARPASDRHPYTLYLWRSLPPLTCRFGLCRSRGRQSHLPQLSHKQASRCRYSSWRRLRIRLVWLHNLSQKSWMGRVGTRDMDREDASHKRSRGSGRPGRFRVGTMGGEETEAKLPIPGQEEQVSPRYYRGQSVCNCNFLRGRAFSILERTCQGRFPSSRMVSSRPIGSNPSRTLRWQIYGPRSTIIIVCRGRDMALEMLPECNKTKTKCVVLADCIQRCSTSPCLFPSVSSTLFARRSCARLGTCSSFVHNNTQWMTATTIQH
jgi:hypothetical protein